MGNKRNKSKTRYRKFVVAGGKPGLKSRMRNRLHRKKLEETLSKLKKGKGAPVMSIKKKTRS